MPASLNYLQQLAHRLRLLARSLRFLARDHVNLRWNLRQLHAAWKEDGASGLKSALAAFGNGMPEPGERQLDPAAYALAVRRAVRRLRAPVSIGILVPVFNTPEAMLRAMLESVRAQWYPHWQLCIADDASSAAHVRPLLQEYAQRDPRIRLHLGQSNRGVSHATNQALALCDCPFVVLLDHDDLLEPQAIYRVAESVREDDPDMLYSDEVVVSEDGAQVLQHVLRPAFSPEYLREHPYIVHLLGFRTALLRRLGGLDESLAISQDYDLVLRASEQARSIVHIPEILYRWRTHASSAGHTQADEVVRMSTAILQRHLQRVGLPGQVQPGAWFNFYAPHYTLQPGQRVAIIIPTKDQGALVRQCIDSLQATTAGLDCDILLIDHDSSDPAALACFAQLGASGVKVRRYSGAFNFSAINNWAVRQLGLGYSHYLFCNNDIQALEPGWLQRMLALAQQPGVGIVGAQLLYPDQRTIQHAGVCVGAYGVAEHYGKFLQRPEGPWRAMYQGRLIATHEVAAVTAACLLMRSETFEALNGYDESLAVGFGDVDLCLRTLQAGWRILYCPHATLIHHESYTRGKAQGYDPHPEDSAAFLARWHRWIAEVDPYYHPALDQNSTCWQPREPLPCTLALRRRVWQPAAAQPGQQQLRRPAPARPR
ncbi:glycosyltransferase family 2 protein [Comamonas sp. NLF-1-9]|uniref:glycosyltransferase family 2 protein n=1 Tax=Comamonas sp. NLF-1-9 TaxID=2853163 RepID=UPI001C479661|nr:glycosyltransferase family 2 protein [Comamonas sp. NLF-1-9]QXL83544.1 glycosyltransferase family 2 protein [Comamonas sp. NLF-1-9]